MRKTSSVYFCSLLLVICGVTCYSDFEISVPTHVHMGVYGESVVLPCLFPVDSSRDIDGTVVTWQRQLEVVHSFYYGQDQLQHQSQRYINRTSLFHQDLKIGNASLRLDHITLQDAGEYTCSISTQLGSQKKSFSLKIAAFYPEPHLHISLLNDGQVEVLVTSSGGYPSPKLHWLMGNLEDITNDTKTHVGQDHVTQLYSVNSKLNLTSAVNSSITFILKNQELGQEIRRNIDLVSENEEVRKEGLKGLTTGICIIGVLFLIELIIAAVLIKFYRSVRKSQKKILRTSESSSLT